MRIVITGGSGLLAMNWGILKRSTADVHLLSHTLPVQLKGVHCCQAELAQVKMVTQLLDEMSPDLVIHTAGMTNVDACESNPKPAHYANSCLAGVVALVCRDLGIKLVHISTDHLFDGTQALLTETDFPSPLNIYGCSKLDGENRVLETNKDALVVRTNFYGWGHRRRASFSDWVINSLRSEERIPVFSDVFYTPILIDNLVACVHDLVELQVSGVVNVVGDTRLSKYDFARLLAKEFRLPVSLISKVESNLMSFKALRPKDMSLSNAKLCALLGRKVGSVEDEIHRLCLQEQQGRPQELNQAL